MRRLFWVVLGATAGILLARKLSRTARSFTPAGLSDSIGALGDAIRDFSQDVKAAMSEREAELMAALTDDGTELPSAGTP